MTIFDQINNFSQRNIPFLVIIDYEINNFYIKELSQIGKNEDIFFEIESKNINKIDKDFYFQKEPVDFKEYEKIFLSILEEIKNGNTYLLNLTFPTKINTDLTLKEIYKYSNAKFKLFFKNQFVCFSPERFIKIENGVISTYPMKGTIDAMVENAQKTILEDEKETAEHTMIVDFLRNDLSIVAKNVKVEKFRYLDKVASKDKELLQVSSKISGTLRGEWRGSLGNILKALLPAGSISGAPKKSSCEIIKKVENYKRNFFSGICGIYDGKNFDSFVLIRYIENTKNGFIFKSGGGITALSCPKKEYQEMLDKVYVPIF